MATSPYLNLPLTDASETTKKFLDFRVELASSDANSALMLIDTKIEEIDEDISGKVDKVSGKTLTTNDFTNSDATSVRTTFPNHISDTGLHIQPGERGKWNNKVDKESGKGLSSLDFTQTILDKIDETSADLTTHVSDNNLHTSLPLQTTWNNTATNFNSHSSNTDIHTSLAEKNMWNAKETPAGAQAKADAALQSAKEYTDEKEANIPFVYNCTGTNDSVTIQGILRDFFKNGTAMSMKLIITGKMGYEYTSNAAFNFQNQVNDRGAVCELDFSDCELPNISLNNVYFFRLELGSYARFIIKGANITCAYSCLSAGNLPIVLESCNFTTTTYNHCISFITNINNYVIGHRISNCTISSLGSTLYTNYTHDCVFENTTFNGGVNGSGATVIQLRAGDRHNFVNCKINSLTGGSCVAIYDGNSHVFQNCNIVQSYLGPSSGGSAFVFSANSYGSVRISNCRIIGYTNSPAIAISGGFSVDGTTITDSYIESSSSSALDISSSIIGNLCLKGSKFLSRGNSQPAFKNASAMTSFRVQILGCEFNSLYTYAVQQTSSSSTCGWNIFGSTFSSASIAVNGGTINATNAVTNGFVYHPAYANYYSASYILQN